MAVQPTWLKLGQVSNACFISLQFLFICLFILKALDDGTKQSTIATAHSQGAVVTVSLGGSTDSPWDKDPTTVGKQVLFSSVSGFIF